MMMWVDLLSFVLLSSAALLAGREVGLDGSFDSMEGEGGAR
jgi:hypothetical protein